MNQKTTNGVQIPVKVVNQNESENAGEPNGEAISTESSKGDDEVVEESKLNPFEELRAEVEKNRDRLAKPDELIGWIQEASDSDSMAAEQTLPILRRLLKAELSAWENHDLRLRSSADLENFKKRTRQEKSRLLNYKNDELLRDLLPILDNMRRAQEHSPKSEDIEVFTDGLRLINDMFRDVLERYGVKEIEALNEKFDPNWHEALSQIPVEGKEPNIVVEELEKGYTYEDRLLRPSRVVVSARVEESNSESQE